LLGAKPETLFLYLRKGRTLKLHINLFFGAVKAHTPMSGAKLRKVPFKTIIPARPFVKRKPVVKKQ
jgi:hypothetical protein